MASYIKTLKEDNGDITYPQTLASAVFIGNSDVETEMGKYVKAEDIASTSALTPPVTTGMIADDAVTPSKITSSAYSTSEQVVGTWIDGKTIYRKVFTFDTQGAQSYSLDISSSNVGEITNMFTTFKQNQDGSGVTAFAPYANNNFDWIILVQRAKYTNTDTLFYYHGSQVANLRYGTTVLEYTKSS